MKMGDKAARGPPPASFSISSLNSPWQIQSIKYNNNKTELQKIKQIKNTKVQKVHNAKIQTYNNTTIQKHYDKKLNQHTKI